MLIRYLIGHSDNPSLDEAMRLACNVSAVPNAYIVEAAVLTSGTIYRWLKESIFRPDCPDSEAFAAINAEAERAPAGANDLLLLPHFKGCGAPHWDPGAKGVFYNLTLSTTRGDMARAVFEGIAVEMKGSLELLETLCGPIQTVSASGGMTKSSFFNQIQSDVFERPVVRFQENEATSLGAWIAGAVAIGLESSYSAAFGRVGRIEAARTYQPNHANRETYRRQGERSRALYLALASPAFRGLFDTWDSK